MSDLDPNSVKPQDNVLTPGMHVQPSPMTINVIAHKQPDGSTVVTAHVEHATGATILFMDSDFAKAIGQQLIEKASGLTLAKPGDIPNG